MCYFPTGACHLCRSVSEYCNAPYLKPKIDECAAPQGGGGSFLFSGEGENSSWSGSWFDRSCDCETVAGYEDGYDKVSCGCQGGRFKSSRFTFTILYTKPVIGAILSSFLAANPPPSPLIP